MDDMTQEPRYQAEKRKPINRPKYKGESLMWCKLFIGSTVVCGLLFIALLGVLTFMR